MTQIATVQEILGPGLARIAVQRVSACGESCSACGGCGDMRPTVTAEAVNQLGAEVGDRVIVESSTGQIFRAAAVVYLIPLVLFFIGYFIAYSQGGSEGISALVGFLCFLVSFFVAKAYNKRISERKSISFVITRFADRMG